MKTKQEKPSRFTLADTYQKEEKPRVIWPIKTRPEIDLTSFIEVPFEDPMIDVPKEPLVRVFPRTGRDVAFLRMLEHRVDKFAPANGCGVLVRARLVINQFSEQ